MPSPFAIFCALVEDDPELPAPPAPPEESGEGDDDVMAHVKSAIQRIDEPVTFQGDTEQGYWIKKLSLAQSGRGNRKKLENNTYAVVLDGRPGAEEVGILLHGTYVVRIRSDNSCVVNTGGWQTVTTQDRINTHLPGSWFVYSVKGSWYWGNRATGVGTYQDTQEGVRVPYQSGDMIDGNGVLHPQNPPEVRKVRPRKRMTRDEWDNRYRY